MYIFIIPYIQYTYIYTCKIYKNIEMFVEQTKSIVTFMDQINECTYNKDFWNYWFINEKYNLSIEILFVT